VILEDEFGENGRGRAMVRIYIPQPKSNLVNLWLDCHFDITTALANQGIISEDRDVNLVTDDGMNWH
jgi:hypothetical protein